MLVCGLYFGAFQAIMPFIGYLLGAQFDTLVSSLAPYIAFILLALIGINMIRESRSKDEEDEVNADFSWRAMLPLAVATSIDALAVGVSFAFLQVNILPAVCLIGLTTFVWQHHRRQNRAVSSVTATRHAPSFSGGLVLIVMGLRILIEHFLGKKHRRSSIAAGGVSI